MVKAYTSIYNKETRARIENLQPSELLVGKNGTHNVKIYAEKRTKRGWRVDWLSRLQVGLLTSLRHHKLISWRINRL